MSLAWIAGGALLGAIVGSFVAVLVLRWPEGRSVGGRSACDGCGAMLRAWELVPVASAVLLRGRCARCGGRIDPFHVQVELLGAAIGGIALGVAPGPAGAIGAGLGWALLALALLDLRHFWLPDRLTLPLGAAGLALGLPAWPYRLIGAAAGFGALWLIGRGYRAARGRVGLGGGDAKLLGALGAWLGWRALPGVVLAAALLGLAWALISHLRGREVAATTRLPLGTMLAIAGWGGWLLLAG